MSGKDWRSKLGSIVTTGGERPKRPGPTEARAHVERFIDTTVLSAFRTLSKELQGRGRKTRIERTKHQAVLTVLRDGKEEFSYAVRGRVFHKMTFAWPVLDQTRRDPRMARIEMSDPDGTDERDLEDVTEQDIIDDFIEDYAKWVGWKHESET